MTLDKLYKKYKEHHWIEEEILISNHLMDSWCTCYLQPAKVFPKNKVYSFVFFLVEGDHLYEWSSKQESRQVLDWMISSYAKDKNYWRKKDYEHKLISDKIRQIFFYFRDNDIKNFSPKVLWQYYQNLLELGSENFSYNLITEAMDAIDGSDYVRFLSKVPNEKLSEVIGLLSQPDYSSFLEREQLSLLKIAKKYFYKNQIKNLLLNKKIKSLEKYNEFWQDLLNHQKDFFWMQNNYKQAHYISLDYFLHALAEIYHHKNIKEIEQAIIYAKQKKTKLSQVRKKLYKDHQISKEVKDFFALIRLMAAWQDRRKENTQRIIAAVDNILSFISRGKKIPKSILGSYFSQDIKNIILKNKKLSKLEIKKRKTVLFYTYLDKNYKIKKQLFFGRPAAAAKQYFQRHLTDKNNNQGLSGFVASFGERGAIVRGIANIVRNPYKDKFQKGAILVTGMTRPEFVPYMKQAKAVITNEGGITTHAAIISRELKIPCIIGTKVATKFIKNGDKLEIDMDKGLIKKI